MKTPPRATQTVTLGGAFNLSDRNMLDISSYKLWFIIKLVCKHVIRDRNKADKCASALLTAISVLMDLVNSRASRNIQYIGQSNLAYSVTYDPALTLRTDYIL